MYYTEQEVLVALNKAKDTLNSRQGEERWGYNDCWSLVVEYDKELRGDNKSLHTLNLKYNNHDEFEKAVEEAGYASFELMMDDYSFHKAKTKRPKTGDIGYIRVSDGNLSAIIADERRWITANEKGVRYLFQRSFIETKIPEFTRPYRS